MKKVLSLIIALSLLLSMTSFSLALAEEVVVINQSFEGDIGAWRTTSSTVGDKFEVVEKEATDGNKSLRIYDDSEETASGIRSGNIKAEPDTKYKLTADLKLISGDATVYLRFYDSNKKQITQNSLKGKAGELVNVMIEGLSPSNTATIEVIVMTNTAMTGECFIDNIKVVSLGKMSGSELEIVNAPSKSFNVNTNTKQGENALFESFENELVSWRSHSSAVASQYERSDKDKTDGSKSLRIWDDSDKTQYGVRSGYIPVKEFTKYTLSVDIKPVGGDASVYFRIYDSDKVQINNRNKKAETGKWTTETLEVESGFNGGYVEIIITTAAAMVGECFVDNIKVIDSGEVKKDLVSGPMQNEINAKLENAKPGEIIEIPDGTYKDVVLVFRASGEEGKPITLKAKNDGKVILKGKSQIKYMGNYQVVSGITFNEASSEQLVRFEEESNYCVFTNSMIYECDHEDITQSQKQVYIRGRHNTVSNCYFRGKSSVGQMIEAPRDQNDDPDYHTIENCYFGDFRMGSVNGLETIRIGRSDRSQSHSNSIIRNCFFEKCDGENELISLKSGGNQVIYNTFYNSQGSMHFRQGNSSILNGNIFIGPKLSVTSSGVTIHDKNHKVTNNYFYAMPEGYETIRFSDSDPRDWLHGFWPVKNVDVSNNTFVDVDYGVQAGYYYVPSNPENMAMRTNPPSGTFNNNAIITYKGSMPIIENQDAKRVNDTPYGNGLKHGITFENNFVTGKAVGYEGGTPSGVTEGKFDYEITDGFVVPKNGAGASLEEIKKAPKSPYDIMPKWVKEQYYDTGIIKFEILSYDPFNAGFDVKSILPEEGKINVIMNGKRKVFDVDPQLINSRTMVPLRAIFEEFGAEVSWDEATLTATAVSNLNTIKITENSSTGYVNDAPVALDSPAVIVNGRFLVPLRFISEAYGAQVSWVDATETAVINYAKRKITGMDDTVYKPLHNIENALTIYGTNWTMEKNSGCVFPLMFDGSFGSRWAYQKSEDGSLGYGVFDLGEEKTLDKLYLSFLNGEKRSYKFSISVSDDNINYTPVLTEVSSSGKTNLFETYDLGGAKGRYIKMTGHGNSAGADWNDPSEFVVTGK